MRGHLKVVDRVHHFERLGVDQAQNLQTGQTGRRQPVDGRLGQVP